jgi:hypothetical protein
MGPGESLSFKLEFTTAGNVAFIYDIRVLAAAGAR